MLTINAVLRVICIQSYLPFLGKRFPQTLSSYLYTVEPIAYNVMASKNNSHHGPRLLMN